MKAVLALLGVSLYVIFQSPVVEGQKCSIAAVSCTGGCQKLCRSPFQLTADKKLPKRPGKPPPKKRPGKKPKRKPPPKKKPGKKPKRKPPPKKKPGKKPKRKPPPKKKPGKKPKKKPPPKKKPGKKPKRKPPPKKKPGKKPKRKPPPKKRPVKKPKKKPPPKKKPAKKPPPKKKRKPRSILDILRLKSDDLLEREKRAKSKRPKTKPKPGKKPGKKPIKKPPPKKPPPKKPKKPAPKKPKKPPPKKTPLGNTLYRTLRPDENPGQGIRAKDPSAQKSIQSHVGCGCRAGYRSQYISTTKDYNVAVHYGGNNRIVSINVARARSAGCRFDDLSDGGNLRGLAKNFAAASKEVLISGCTIPSNAVTVVRA